MASEGHGGRGADSPGDASEDPSPGAKGPQGQAQQEPSLEEPPPLRGGVGLRVAVYCLSVLLAISVAASVLLQFLDGPQAVQEMSAPDAEFDAMLFLWLRLATLPVALGVTLFFVVRLDRKELAEIGLTVPRASGIHGLLASFLAALSLGGWFLLADPWVESQLAEFSGDDLLLDPWLPVDAASMLSISLGFFGLAFLDELIFRGYVYSVFRERFTWVHAAGLANLLSVALYAGHPQIGAAGLINTFLLGLVLAAMREKTGSLLMPSVFLGVWNVLLGCGLSLPVSGTYFPRLYDHQISGPSGITGGEFGPEGSWLLTGLLLGLVLLLAWWVETDAPDQEPKSPIAGTEPSD